MGAFCLRTAGAAAFFFIILYFQKHSYPGNLLRNAEKGIELISYSSLLHNQNSFFFQNVSLSGNGHDGRLFQPEASERPICSIRLHPVPRPVPEFIQQIKMPVPEVGHAVETAVAPLSRLHPHIRIQQKISSFFRYDLQTDRAVWIEINRLIHCQAAQQADVFRLWQFWRRRRAALLRLWVGRLGGRPAGRGGGSRLIVRGLA